MTLNTVKLNLDDYNFDYDDPETIIYVRLIASCKI